MNDLLGIDAALEASEGNLAPLLERLRASNLSRDEIAFIEARLTNKGGTMRRGPKVRPETARRDQDIILADVWFRYIERVRKKDARHQMIADATGLSLSAIRKALRTRPSLWARLEIDHMRQCGRIGIPVPPPAILNSEK